jgi:hypothetical protein
MLASFLGVLPILTPPLCALAFIMVSLRWSVSLEIRVFPLNYQRKFTNIYDLDNNVYYI